MELGGDSYDFKVEARIGYNASTSEPMKTKYVILIALCSLFCITARARTNPTSSSSWPTMSVG